MSRPNNGTSVLEALGVGGGNVYDLALTHRSYAFEQPGDAEHNERLELLGDSVLGLIVTDLIFRTYPSLPEGQMAVLRASVVNTLALADVARSIGLPPHIRLGRGEEATGGRDKASVLADTFEAVVGAAYLEIGMDRVARALTPVFATAIEKVVSSGESLDAKGALQELVVGRGIARPVYEVTSSGPDHDKRFSARAFVRGEVAGVGSGRSKKEAEQNAAREALNALTHAIDTPSVEQTAGGADARAS